MAWDEERKDLQKLSAEGSQQTVFLLQFDEADNGVHRLDAGAFRVLFLGFGQRSINCPLAIMEEKVQINRRDQGLFYYVSNSIRTFHDEPM